MYVKKNERLCKSSFFNYRNCRYLGDAQNSRKISLIADYINIDTYNDLFVKYFDKFAEFLAKPLKIFTKDILNLNFNYVTKTKNI